MSEATMGERRMLIGGELVEAANGATYDNVNPATEEVIGATADGSAEDALRAVEAARRAFDETGWATDHELRARCLEQLQAGLREAAEELRAVVIAEAGSPHLLTYLVQTDQPISWLSYWPDLARSYAYDRELPVAELAGERSRGILAREPVGVVGAITAFNFPLYLNLCKLGPALAAGCTVVLKPAPDTPWTATVIGRVIAERTDIPPGVVNVIPSSSTEVGEVLTTDPRVDMVSFTGSTATGRRIMAAAAETVKRVQLELGGKSANIVLDDADLNTALAMAIPYSCTHAGQGCGLYTRLLLPRSRYDEALAFLQMGFQNFPYGDPTTPGVLVGPVINGRQRDRVLDHIGKAVADGARVLAGGGRPAHLERGFWIEPTLLADVDPHSSIAQEEIFGPVLSVIPFDDDDDAVRIANNSMYGLAGAVWSGDAERALALARRIRTGTVTVNGGSLLDVSRPWGGYRQSGLGRENGVQGFEDYLETKVLSFPA